MTVVHWPIKVGCGRLENPSTTTEMRSSRTFGREFRTMITTGSCILYVFFIYLYRPAAAVVHL